MARSRQSGHTLFELLVVLAILAFVASVAAPAIGGSRGSLEAKALAHAIEDDLKLARSRAVASGENASIILDIEGGRYRTENNAGWTMIAKKLSLSFASAAPVAGDFPAIFFYPDGSSSGGEIKVAAKGRLWVVRAALNGKVLADEEG